MRRDKVIKRLKISALILGLLAVLFLGTGSAAAILTLASDAITSVGNLVLSATTGIIDVNSNLITNLGNAAAGTDALNRNTGDSRYVDVAGDIMTGILTLGANLNAASYNLTEVDEVRFSDGTGFIETPFDLSGTWAFTREAANPVIPLVAGGDREIEQYIPNCVVTPAGGINCYVKGTSNVWGYSSSNGVAFTVMNGGSPVLTPGAGGQWDDMRTWPQEVWYDTSNTTYYMLYYGSNTGGTAQIGLATSANGIAWTKEPTNPVLGDTDLETTFGFTNISHITMSSFIKIGSTYYGYGSAKATNDLNNTYTMLFYATSTNLTTWTPQAILLTLADAQNIHESPNIIDGLQSPEVFRYNGLYYFTYAVRYSTGTPRIELRGQGVSVDGISWRWLKDQRVLAAGTGSDPDAGGTYSHGFLKANTSGHDTLYRDSNSKYRLYYSCGDPTTTAASCLAYANRIPVVSASLYATEGRYFKGVDLANTMTFTEDWIGNDSLIHPWAVTGTTPSVGGTDGITEMGLLGNKTAASGTSASYVNWNARYSLSGVGTQQGALLSNREKYFLVRAQLNDTTQLTAQIGLYRGTPPLGAADGGWWFECDLVTGTANWYAFQSDDGTAGTVSEDTGVACNNTTIRTFAILATYKGGMFWIDGNLVANTIGSNTNVETQSLEPVFYVAEKEAVQKDLWIDYVYIEARR